MKKLFLLFITGALSINFAFAQSTWVNYKVDNKITVKVPTEPKAVDANSVMAKDGDNLVCIVSVIDFLKVAGLDSAALVPMAPTQEFADQMKTGMLQQMAGFTLGDIKIGKWHGYNSYNIEGGNTATKVKVYTFMVIIGKMLYSFSVVNPDDKPTEKKDAFFNSLTLN